MDDHGGVYHLHPGEDGRSRRHLVRVGLHDLDTFPELDLIAFDVDGNTAEIAVSLVHDEGVTVLLDPLSTNPPGEVVLAWPLVIELLPDRGDVQCRRDLYTCRCF